ncbi:MAG: undecaprenyldiphospho-muramoylpentapeptide beta-N-acetylglucosaminyltransferase [Burkholderiales bacterium]|nr:undecaprenyldiphospho-muramoylpentapeptide beta-N-acetylglucosaminyltransferase [Burkholderiales bacterium]
MKTALILAAGTGGHIFPGLAVAHRLRERGWNVCWLGAASPSMESQLVPPHGFELATVQFKGVRGKGLLTFILLPFTLLRACWQSLQVMRRIKPDVVLGMGGYISLPAGIVAAITGRKLVLHEQNSVAGMSNKVLAVFANKVLTTFPNVLKKSEWIGNPLREAFIRQARPRERLTKRHGPLQLLVVGGSLGAQALNTVVPQALALMSEFRRPVVIHQSGAKQIDALHLAYEQADVQATLTPFIEDTAQAFAHADVVIARAGASTVSELAAIGVAAIYVPFPHAVDDHQTKNAKFVVDAGGGWLLPQAELTAQGLADLLQTLTREKLVDIAEKAYALRKTDATEKTVAICEHLVSAEAVA